MRSPCTKCIEFVAASAFIVRPISENGNAGNSPRTLEHSDSLKTNLFYLVDDYRNGILAINYTIDSGHSSNSRITFFAGIMIL